MSGTQAVITGMGIVSPIGIGVEDYWAALLGQVSGIRPLTERTDEESTPGDLTPEQAIAGCKIPGLWIGAPILDFEPKQYVRPRKALKVMCREIRTAFAASQLAIENAGLTDMLPACDDGPFEPGDVATIFGGEMYYGPPTEMIDSIAACFTDSDVVNVGAFGASARKEVMPLWMLKYLPNMPACHVGISVNAHGPNNTLVVGDVSGPAALVESVGCIDRGFAKIAISGAAGTRVSITRMNYRSDSPIATIADPVAHSSRPHDPSSSGIVGGEGAACLIIESAGEASGRGTTPIARIAGFASRFCPSTAMRAGGRTNQNTPNSRASVVSIGLAIDGALAKAGIAPDKIGAVISNASGDPISDAAEREAITQRFATTPVVAPMAAIGHTGAASGTIGIVTGALCLANQLIPPTINAKAASANLLETAQRLDAQYVLCLSYTSEGNSIAVVLSSS